tara:strand:+ start:6010 stop:7377 length:1368 start_codon:yes stop_codon:yes gene_type:complete
MAQNIALTNSTSSISTKEIETCNRPILVSYLGSGTPNTTLVQIQVKSVVSGVTTNLGVPLIQGRDVGSTLTSPTFTFDISSILKSTIPKDTYNDLFSTANGANGIDRASSFLLIKNYSVSARSWYIDTDTGILTLNEDDAEISTAVDSLKVCDIEIPNREINSLKTSNTLPASFKLSGWRMDAAILADANGHDFYKFLTNCPSSVRRKIPVGFPMGLSILAQNNSAALKVSIITKNNSGTSYAFNATTGQVANANANTIKTLNLSISDSFLLSTASNTTLALMGGGNFSAKITKVGGASSTNELNFEIVDINSTTNSSFKRVRNAQTIYFVNDYNLLDFYTFESNLGISHVNSKDVFKTANKDYTKRNSSNRGVSRGMTEEVYTLSAIINKETSAWLSELYRSTNVFIYEIGDDNVGRFCPVSVIDADTVPLAQEITGLDQFSLSFIKDTFTVNR